MSQKRHIASLDGLRAISISFVFASHLLGTAHYPGNSMVSLIFPYGHFGVQVFFVLSGFLITRLLLREREQTGSISLPQFYRRRAYRILPAAFVYSSLAVAGTLTRGQHLSASYVAEIYTFLVGYGHHGIWQFAHLWSLGAEEQFYLLWPVALVLAFRFRLVFACSVLVLSALFRSHFPHQEYAFPAVADSMAVGSILAMFTPHLRRLPRELWSLPVALGLVAITLGSVRFIHTRNTLYWGIEPVLIALTMFVLVQRADRVLNNRFICFVGRLSYALYLTQQPFLNRFAHLPMTAFPLNVVCAIGCALLIHYLVEQPMLQLGATRHPRAEVLVESMATA